MEPQEILTTVREAIRAHAGDDPDKWFYANRFVFARLQLDERRTKTQIKRELLQAGKPCHYCNKPFGEKTGICLHRLDGDRGYSPSNCVLMHPACHVEYHKQNPRERGERIDPASPILDSGSKRYDNQRYIYWWDITPARAGEIDRYEVVEFVKSDTEERCHVPTATLKGFLAQERRTSRGKGNWGIRVLKDREGELAFEPGNRKDKWLFLPVVWLNDGQED